MNEAILELTRHKTWATLRLIEYCDALGDEQLDATDLWGYAEETGRMREFESNSE